MTHKIELLVNDRGVTILFQGTLDDVALYQMKAFCKRFRSGEVPVHIVLDTGTKVETGTLEELVRIEGIELEAKSPFLSRWIESCLDGKG